MSKTVREIAELMGVSSNDLVKEKQRIRDEIKRQNIGTKKLGNKFVIADSDVEKITSALKEKLDKEDSKKKEAFQVQLEGAQTAWQRANTAFAH